MGYSANGWSAPGSPVIARYTVPGTNVKVALRRGDASVVLLEVLRRFNNEVQQLRQADTGGYSYRRVRGRGRLSNHASGTAVDCRWRDHPLGRRGTYNSGQRAAIRRILKDMGGVVRWGGDYRGRPDEMHFELNASPSAVHALANRLRGRQTQAPLIHGRQRFVLPDWPWNSRAVFHPYMKGTPPTYATVEHVQHKLFSIGYQLSVDGRFGPATRAAVVDFQRRHGLEADGLIGVKTYAKLKAA